MIDNIPFKMSRKTPESGIMTQCLYLYLYYLFNSVGQSNCIINYCTVHNVASFRHSAE